MTWQAVEYCHPAIHVKVGGKTYQFTVRDDGTIEQPLPGLDAQNAALATASLLEGLPALVRSLDSRRSWLDDSGMKVLSYLALSVGLLTET
jgi:hypothetical protein